MYLSIEIHRRPSSRGATYMGSLYLRVIYARQSCEWTLPWRLFAEEWDQRERSVRIDRARPGRESYLREAAAGVERAKVYLSEEFMRQKAEGNLSARRLVARYKTHQMGCYLKPWTEQLAAQLVREGQERTARAYLTAVHRLLTFVEKDDLELTRLTPDLFHRFERALRIEGRSDNTISFYMRMLRALFNKAVEGGLIARPSLNPFGAVFTGVARTRKRALSTGQIRALMTFDWQNENLPFALQQAYALFLFSFWARGMSFVDVAFLRKRDIRHGILTYRRRKTGTELEIPLTPEMHELIHWFAPLVKDSPYVFPLIRRPGTNEYKQYESALRLQNKRLRHLTAQIKNEELRMKNIKKMKNCKSLSEAQSNEELEEIKNEELGMKNIKKIKNEERRMKNSKFLPSHSSFFIHNSSFVLPLSTHVSRHTWATRAKQELVPLSQISEALGHRSEKTTSIYLASFGHTVWQEINHKIRDSIKKSS